MIELQNDRLIRALLRQPVDKTPIWIMRQAGRYLPEYRKVRSDVPDFMSLCRSPDLACEVTLQPLRRFDLDAAIIFSDILTIPDAMGLGLQFVAGEGPQFQHPIHDQRDVAKLGVPDPNSDLQYVMDAIALTRRELNGRVPLIGFSGSPWTLACYMVEGSGSKTFNKVRGLYYRDPQCLHQLLNVLADSVTHYLNAQIEAGAQALMIFDTWGGVLTQQAFKDCSLQYMQKILAGLNRQYNGTTIPVTLFSKNASQWLELLAQTGCDGLGVDWMTQMSDAKQRVGSQVALQGNLDPAALYATPERLRDEVKNVLEQFGPGSGHVFNLGHGIERDVDPENVKVLVDAVHELSVAYHE